MTAYVFLIAITIIAHIFFRYEYIDKRRRGLAYGGEDFDYDSARSRVESRTIGTFFVIYIALLCLRDSTVGVDVRGYINNYFYQFKALSWQQIVEYKGDELVFSALTKVIGAIFSSPQIYLSIIAIASVGPVMYLYKREVKGALLCCSFFLISLVFEIFFSGLRQAVAVGLTVPAFYFAKDKKIFKFILVVLFAMTFHLSAAIMFLIYPIYHAKITRKWLWFVLPIMAIIYRFNSEIFNFLLLFSGEKYYTKYGVWGLGTTNQYGLLVLFVLIAVYCFVVLDEEQADADDIGFRNLLLLATLIQFFAPLHFIVSRMNYYFILFIPIALTRANYKCKPQFWQLTKIASAVMTVYFIVYFFFMKGDTLHIMDYKFFF